MIIQDKQSHNTMKYHLNVRIFPLWWLLYATRIQSSQKNEQVFIVKCDFSIIKNMTIMKQIRVVLAVSQPDLAGSKDTWNCPDPPGFRDKRNGPKSVRILKDSSQVKVNRIWDRAESKRRPELFLCAGGKKLCEENSYPQSRCSITKIY